jgi:2-oxoglutarate ferredoxin oxidoreductase subunit beta
MSAKNEEYDFKWCPGCGDFGVRRALDGALKQYRTDHEMPGSNTVVVAGIGCSGNMVHLLEDDDQPFGIHGIHGRSLPIALGVKMARPELNVVVTAGDGDFLSIGQEHIAPQAARNLNITAIVMDNGVYGLTKGQSSPTTKIDTITSSTPFGKPEDQLNPLKLYLTLGVSYVTSQVSNKIRDLTAAMVDAMNHPGFSIVHVHSPCTIYNDTYKALKGDPKNGIDPLAWNIADDHDPSDLDAAYDVVDEGGIPVGLIYRDATRPSFTDRINHINEKSFNRTLEKLVDSYAI